METAISLTVGGLVITAIIVWFIVDQSRIGDARRNRIRAAADRKAIEEFKRATKGSGDV